MAVVMIATAVAVSGYGFYQCYYEMPQLRAEYAADPERALAEVGLSLDSPERRTFEDRLNNTEPLAAFALTNSLAGFLTPWLVMLVGIAALELRGGCARGQPWRLLLCLAPIAACLLLTKSRSGYVAAVAGSLWACWLALRDKSDGPIFADAKNGTVSDARKRTVSWKLPAAAFVLATTLVVAAVAVEGPAVLGRAAKSFGYRLQYWQSTLRMIADRPWFGCGPGNFQETYPQYKLPEASEEIADPHNFLLEVGATAGVPAAAALLAVLALCFLSFFRRAYGSEGDEAIEAPSALARTLSQKERGPDTKTQDCNSEIIRSPSPAPISHDHWQFILLGGFFGFVLSVPLGLLSAAPPGLASTLIGLPLASGAILLLLGWIREGRLPDWLPGVAAAALLVDLLAAGGIGLPSVAGSLWLLLALSGGQTFLSVPKRNEFLERIKCLFSGKDHLCEYRLAAGWAALAVALLLIVACYFSAYGPVMRCQTRLRLAEREPSRAIAHLEAAAAADPLDAEPWRRLAEIRFAAWRLRPDAERFALFVAARDKVLALAPNSSPDWLTAGDRALRAATRIGPENRPEAEALLRFSIAAYRRAVELYRNSPLHRAKLAEALLASGDSVNFRREAKFALWLDAITPHLNKKLPEALRELLQKNLSTPTCPRDDSIPKKE